MFTLCLWVIILIGFGITVINQMNVLGNQIRYIYEYPLLVSRSAVETRMNIIKIQRLIRDYILFLEEEESTQSITKISELDKEIVIALNIIEEHASTSKVKRLEREIREKYLKWRDIRKEVIRLVEKKKLGEAYMYLKDSSNLMVDDLDTLLQDLENNTQIKADEQVKELKYLEEKQRELIVGLICLFGTVFLSIFNLITKSILAPVRSLKGAMSEGIATGNLQLVHTEGSNEIAEMAGFYNSLTKKAY